MNLVVYDVRHIDDLVALVTQMFSDISNKRIEPIRYGNVRPFQHYMGRFIVYRRKTSDIMQITWETPSLFSYPRNGIFTFLRRLVESPGEHGIVYYMRRRGLAYSAIINAIKADSFYLLTLYITLTDKGLKKTSDIIETVYEYLSMIKNMDRDEYNRHWENYIKIALLTFEYLMDIPPSRYTM